MTFHIHNIILVLLSLSAMARMIYHTFYREYPFKPIIDAYGLLTFLLMFLGLYA